MSIRPRDSGRHRLRRNRRRRDRCADVAVQGDRIAAVAESIEPAGAATLDARGLAVAPGFLDVHTHDDFAVVLHPEMGFKVLGGVTSVVVGNCGMGAAPHAQARGYAAAFHPGNTLPEWQGYGGYLDHLDASPASCNVAALVGHGAVRAAAMGGEARAPSDAELDQMRALVREGVDAGCVGLSTGLIYEPGRHAQLEEIAALAGEFAGTGGLYATHMRDEGAGLLDSVRESIAIGERAGVPVQISHHKASGRENWGKVGASLRLIEEARARGLDVTADQYPYTAASTVLAAVMSYLEGGGGIGQGRAEDIQLSSAPQHPEWEGPDDRGTGRGVGRVGHRRRASRARRRGHRRDRRHAHDVRRRRAHRDAAPDHDDRLRRTADVARQAAPAPLRTPSRACSAPMRATRACCRSPTRCTA